MTPATLFVSPMSLQTSQTLWLVLPISLSIAIVYKTVRTRRPARVWLEILGAFAYILVGLLVLGACLWLVQAYWP